MLKPNAVYFGDNGRAMCADCAGHTAQTTGRDLSGQRLERATARDAQEWPASMAEYGMDPAPLSCECGRVTLTASGLVGPDGWPMTAVA